MVHGIVSRGISFKSLYGNVCFSTAYGELYIKVNQSHYRPEVPIGVQKV